MDIEHNTTCVVFCCWLSIPLPLFVSVYKLVLLRVVGVRVVHVVHVVVAVRQPIPQREVDAVRPLDERRDEPVLPVGVGALGARELSLAPIPDPLRALGPRQLALGHGHGHLLGFSRLLVVVVLDLEGRVAEFVSHLVVGHLEDPHAFLEFLYLSLVGLLADVLLLVPDLVDELHALGGGRGRRRFPVGGSGIAPAQLFQVLFSPLEPHAVQFLLQVPDLFFPFFHPCPRLDLLGRHLVEEFVVLVHEVRDLIDEVVPGGPVQCRSFLVFQLGLCALEVLFPQLQLVAQPVHLGAEVLLFVVAGFDVRPELFHLGLGPVDRRLQVVRDLLQPPHLVLGFHQFLLQVRDQ
mmetsp:Transcript_7434/g.21639  ORF Transcript_7434/g.21639 Transcript_7434/m.21639 type:complete len:349 (+) Transcript_7434:1170-2216(+)